MIRQLRSDEVKRFGPVYPAKTDLSKYGFGGAAKKEKEKAETLEFFWRKSKQFDSESPPDCAQEMEGLQWSVRLRQDGFRGTVYGISFKIYCNAGLHSRQWSAATSFSLELYSSQDLICPIAKETGTFNLWHSHTKSVTVRFEPNTNYSSDEASSTCSSRKYHKDDEYTKFYTCADLEKVTFCRCVLFNVSSTGLKLSQPIYLAPWKLTDENTPHDKVLLVEGVKYYVQSQVLSLWSPYFDKLFNSNFSEGQTQEIELKDVDVGDLEQLLLYIYPQELEMEIGVCNVGLLMELSDRFAMGRVFRRCCSFLMDKDSNLLDMFQLLQLADRYNLVDVKEYALLELSTFPSLNQYIEDHLTQYNMLSLSDRHDVLNIFRQRKTPSKPKSESTSDAEPIDSPPWKLTDESTPHDKVLLVGGVKFYVQSQVFRLWTSYFDKVFDRESDGKQQEFELKDVDPGEFEQLLMYIYPQEERPTVTDSNVFLLMDLSDRFAIRWVFERCRRFLQNSTLNVFQLMQLAGRHNLMDVQESALKKLLEVRSLTDYIEDHLTDYEALSLAARHDVLNVFRLRDKVSRRKRTSYHSDETYYSSDSE